MKITLVHDWLTNFAGAEKVLEAIYEMYPAPIYTLIIDEKQLKQSIFKNAIIYTSFIQKLPKANKFYRYYLPLFPMAIEQFDLSHYDIIISSSTCVAKGVITKASQIHICYCHTPVRYAWDLYHEYLKETGLNRGLKGLIVKIFLHYLRLWDYTTANRVDYFIANSKYVARRIKKIYGKDSVVIYPPVDVEKFNICDKREDYYITVSRMVPYKKIDLIVKAFTKMPDKKLVVIGHGPDLKKIKSVSGKNIELLKFQPFDIMKEYLQRAKAFIFAGEEDFGISLVEAQACGVPVICYAKGGALETVISEKTGVFFGKQDIDCLIESVKYFEKIEHRFDPIYIREHSMKFNKERFKNEFKTFIQEKIRKS